MPAESVSSLDTSAAVSDVLVGDTVAAYAASPALYRPMSVRVHVSSIMVPLSMPMVHSKRTLVTAAGSKSVGAVPLSSE